MTRIVVIAGPTASGKSALAVRLAKERGGEVISADSRQVYRGLDIGTGKITKREMRGVRHHLLDVCSPKRVFTAHDFVRLGRSAIADITARGKLPIVCGGSGFYIDALLGHIELAHAGRDEALRKRLAGKSAAQLFAILRKRDAARAAQLDTESERSNRVRLIRAIEIALGRAPARQKSPMLFSNDRVKIAWGYEEEWVYADWPDDVLKKRIRDRLAARMKGGMVREARMLHARGLSWKRMESLGLEYRCLSRYLRGKLPRAKMLAQLESEIWRYAKRQRTWWRRNKNIRWRTQT